MELARREFSRAMARSPAAVPASDPDDLHHLDRRLHADAPGARAIRPCCASARRHRYPRTNRASRRCGTRWAWTKPIPVQYVIWLKDAAGGDFGNSLKSNMPGRELFARSARQPRAGHRRDDLRRCSSRSQAASWPRSGRGGRFDRLALGFTASGLAIPSFWLGLTLILVFSVVLHWLPPGGYVPFARVRSRTCST